MVKLKALILTLVFCFCSPAIQAEQLTLLVHSMGNAVYTESSGELRAKHHLGRQALLTELVREMAKNLNQDTAIIQADLKQAKRLLLGSGRYALLDVERSGPLASKRAIGPIQSDTIFIFARKDKLEQFKTLSSTKTAKICTRSTTKQAKILKQQGFQNVVEASSYRVCWDDLISGKADLTTLGKNLIPTMQHLARDIASDIANTNLTIKPNDSYLLFSDDVSEVQIEQWKNALSALKQSEDYENLIHHFYCQQDCF